MARIGLIDYGFGNFSSVRHALDYLQLDVIAVCNAAQFDETTHLILPGVGAFAAGMHKLIEGNLIDALREQVLIKKKPFLGICLGMQVLASTGREFESCPGLGFIQGSVEMIGSGKFGLRVPHIGWNAVKFLRPSPIFKRMSETPSFYFLHSYHLSPVDKDVITATCEYGEEVVAALQVDNIYGVQFHPEKSQHDGLQLLKNFASL
jgi:glutamine amidotransferase